MLPAARFSRSRFQNLPGYRRTGIPGNRACHCLWRLLLRNSLYCVRCVAKLTHLIDVSCTTLFHASKHYIRLPRLSAAVVRVSNQRARTCAASIIRLYSAHAHMARNARGRKQQVRAHTRMTSACRRRNCARYNSLGLIKFRTRALARRACTHNL